MDQNDQNNTPRAGRPEGHPTGQHKNHSRGRRGGRHRAGRQGPNTAQRGEPNAQQAAGQQPGETAQQAADAPRQNQKNGRGRNDGGRDRGRNNRGDRHDNRNDRDGKTAAEARPTPDTKPAGTPAPAAPAPVETTPDRSRRAPATGRPQRMPHRSAAPAEIPDMNDLLIEDGMRAPTLAERPEDAPDAAEIERILESDIFARPTCEPIPAVLPEGKAIIVGIRFRPGGKTYFFDPGEWSCTVGQSAIVETARGMEFGEVCLANSLMDESMVVPPLRPVIRIATEEDIRHNAENRERETEAFRVGLAKIAEHKLDMKLVDVQYTFDNTKLLFYFTSAKRVDFRDLVKDLAGVFHIRIELRQIGIRDEARMIGGLGACGRPLCCNTFLSDCGQVSMKMAKEQNLSLNSSKISGCCGRLMCCLRYEHETYAEELRRTPAVGTHVNTPDGVGVVTEVYLIKGEVKVSLRNQPDSPPKKYPRDDVEALCRDKRPTPVEEETPEDAEEL